MNVLVIPEDPRRDGHILRPLFKRLLEVIGKANARVRVCTDPVLGGIGEALKPERLSAIIERYRGMTQVFVLCVDRDGETGRRARLDEIESLFGEHGFLAENAWEELETWVLAGLQLPRDWRWAEVRAEVQVKERYFEPLAEQRGLARGPGGGRRVLGREAARNIATIRQKCPEDFGRLVERLEAIV